MGITMKHGLKPSQGHVGALCHIWYDYLLGISNNSFFSCFKVLYFL
jgi:hypothetical protein